MIICYTVPEIWCVTDVIVVFHLGQYFVVLPPFLTAQKIKISKKKRKKKSTWRYHNFTQLYIKSWLYAILFLRYGAWQIWLLFFILGNFLPFYSPNSQKSENIKKMKNAPGDIIIFHKCIKNHNCMLYCSWDMARDGYNCCFSFWAIFCHFTPLTAQK